MERGAIRPEALAWALDEAISAPETSVEDVLSKFRPRPDDPERLEEVLEDLTSIPQESGERSEQTFIRWAMGEVMREFFGRVDPMEVRARLVQGYLVRKTRGVES
jgi:Glu-tRNA(Gln) amidotransferase subunit E-like FAD-binding protein